MQVKTVVRFALTVLVLGIFRLATATAVDSPAEGAAWLHAQPAQNLTLQLVAVDSPERVGMFVRRHRLSGDLAQIAVSRNGQPSYILVMGSYADRRAAEAAAAALPIKPWIRAIGGIQRITVAASQQPVVLPAPIEPTVKDAAWIWSQDPSHYTLQLASGPKRGPLTKLATALSAAGPVAIYQGVRKGQNGYVLIFGDFDSATAAKQAIQALPAAARHERPSIRPFASVHDALSLQGR